MKALILGGSNKLIKSAVLQALNAVGLDVLASRTDDDDSKTWQLSDFDLILLFVTYPLDRTVSFLVSKKQSSCKIILIFEGGDRLAKLHLGQLPVDAILSTHSSVSELIFATELVLKRGHKYISPSLVTDLALLMDARPAHPFTSLSAKERNVALYIIDGKKNQEIARLLNISHKTVSTHKARLFRKLGVDNDVALARLAHDVSDLLGPLPLRQGENECEPGCGA